MSYVVVRIGSEIVIARVRRTIPSGDGVPQSWGAVQLLAGGGIIRKVDGKEIDKQKYDELSRLGQDELKELRDDAAELREQAQGLRSEASSLEDEAGDLEAEAGKLEALGV